MEYQKAYEYLIKSLTDRWGQMITEGSKLAEQALTNPDDDECALIVEGNDIYVETYNLTNGGRLDIAYSELDKQNFNMFFFRDSICRQHGYTIENLLELVRFTVPKDIYKQMYEEIYPIGEKGTE